MKYPILYAQNATDYFTLGLGPLANTIKATVTEERNGAFYFEAEILVDSPIFPLVLNDCLIKADAGHLLKDQRFRIKRIVPKHDGTAEIYAEHISYLSEELTLKPEVSINGSAIGALSAWKGAIVEPNPFVVDSDISTTNSTKWRIDKVANPRQALGGTEGSILDVWGGEYSFDNYRISLLQKRGTTANTVLAYGRNITDFEQENNIANTYTSIVPYAIYTDDKENEITVTVDGYRVDSQYTGNYPNPRSLPVNFSDKFDHDEVPTKAKLKQLAEQYITANDVGVPKTSIKVSFLDLSKSPDYADYQHLEELNLCDDVRVHYPKLGVDTTAKVIRTVWNVLTESYDEIEIGEKRMTLSSKINEQTKQIKEINTQTNYAITSADGKNTIFVGLYGEDGLGEPTATKVGDSWYKPDGEFTELYVWDGTIWKFLMSTKENHEIQNTITAIENEIEVMVENIDTSLANSEQAIIDAGFANDTALTAVTQAEQAIADAKDAQQTANSFLDRIENTEGSISSIESTVDELNGQLSLKVNQADFDKLDGTVDTNTTQIDINSGQIQLKANQTEVNTIKSDVTSINTELVVQAGSISALNTKTDGHTTQIGNLQSSYDGLRSDVSQVETDLNGKVNTTAFSSLEQLVSGIQTTVADKANQSQVTQLSSQLTSVVTDLQTVNTALINKVDDLAFSLPSTGNNSNLFGCIATVELTAQYQDSTFGVLVYDVEGSQRFADVHIKIRQVNSMGSNPAFDIKMLNSVGIEAAHISAVVVRATSTITETRFFIQMPYTWATLKFEPYNVNRADLITFNPYPSNVTSRPSGTVITGMDYGNRSRITQLSDQIDLRVTKGELIGQINTQAGKVLIRANDNVLMVTGSTTYIADGTIKNAMIDTLNASKITAGTLNAANVSVINLNASNITSGRLNTSNITIGTATSGKRVNITGAGLIAHDNNGKLRVKLGVQDLAGDGQSDPSTLVFYTGNGTRSASIGTNTNDTFVIGTEFGDVSMLMKAHQGITINTAGLAIQSPYNTNTNDYWILGTLTLNGVNQPSLHVPRPSAGILGSSTYRLRQINVTETNTGYLTVGYGEQNPQEGDLRVGTNGTRGYIKSMSAYNLTQSWPVNMGIASDGTMFRSTSARKYKTDIQLADMNKAKTVLQIKPVSWLDKAELADKGHSNRYYGFIADEFDQLGLNEVVMYGSDGQVESLAYDRISMYHNVILKDHEQEIQEIRNQNLTLLGEVQMLRSEVESLRQLVA